MLIGRILNRVRVIIVIRLSSSYQLFSNSLVLLFLSSEVLVCFFHYLGETVGFPMFYRVPGGGGNGGRLGTKP